ncbi:hypothetical protein [Roseobacter ponti]|uniref:Uncharacterized protein n=1 Tax=Roseobacter ponti TaxID=1891787 RepID=A0A858SWP7_9RHOB|nr:hypothetical protein [Roseobacter ponti]QJF52457.1 hypothetical protein G3256_15405 [Roseobacter ponti]
MRHILCSALFCLCAGTAAAGADLAISAFNSVCFKAGQTATVARDRMQQMAGTPLPFTLTFWDKTLEPAPGTPMLIERRCEVLFDGAHTPAAIEALRVQMATPPVFGFAIDLPETHDALPGTALIEGRELLRGRVAVVHVGMRGDQTFMAVDRLPAGWEAM